MISRRWGGMWVLKRVSVHVAFAVAGLEEEIENADVREDMRERSIIGAVLDMRLFMRLGCFKEERKK
tara:strand:- start:200 stop:400 length:201 start_codon:yes stop_codon:yes gene_type:complete